MLIVGTSEHLEDIDREYTIGEDLSVTAVAVSPAGPPAFALLDGERIARVDELELTPVVRLPSTDAQSLGAADGQLVVGCSGARLLTIDLGSGNVSGVPSFDEVPGRAGWQNPAVPIPELRSLAVTASGAWLVNVRVGGVWRSADQGSTWANVVPPEADVHEVVAGTGRRVVAAAASGFGWSTDDGVTWEWTTEGMHASYCRAVALDGDRALVTASTGPSSMEGRIYRAELGARFEQCLEGLPDSFPFNLDTGCLAARGGIVAFGTPKGQVFRSVDGGASFASVGERMRPVHVVRFA
ncbi:MAG: WD40/YVTN/BNR-like repeat-containing protein [Acidimicrobiales bacterium]